MRTVTVDTQGLFFAFKIALVMAMLGAGWYAWEPVSILVRAEVDEDARVASAAMGTTVGQDVERGYVPPELTSSLQGKYLYVDVDQMRVTLHEGGLERDSLSILHVPVPESPDALLSGSYTVDAIQDAEVSTVTLVRYPHYVRFGDRYALHASPIETEGEALPETYAGNSVLLSVDDARSVAEFSEPGMIVYVDAPEQKEATYTNRTLRASEELPATSASAYVLRDLESNQEYLVQGGNERYPIASITKLVTATVAHDVLGHDADVLAPNGEHYTLGDLFYPLLLRSDNAIAERIAVHAGKEEFIGHMNAYVRAHGMYDSSFEDSSGLSPKNISTAQDLAILAQHLYDTKAYLLGMTSEAEVTIISTEGTTRLVVNQNKLADDPHFRGGKLGYTDEAGQTALTIFNVPLAGETRPIAVVILGSKDWKQDTRTLLRWLVNTAEE